MGDTNLCQGSATRMIGNTFAKPVVFTNSDVRFSVVEQRQEVGIDTGEILIELEGRNTAPAVLAAAIYLPQKDLEAIMLVAPSDDVAPDADRFRTSVQKGLEGVNVEKLVTFDLTSPHGETAYGYIQLSDKPNGGPVALKRFVEKPGADHAAESRNLADAWVFLLKTYSGYAHVNVGSAVEVTFRELAETIAEAVGYEAELFLDTAKSDGARRKLMHSSRLHEMDWDRARSRKVEIVGTYEDWVKAEK